MVCSCGVYSAVLRVCPRCGKEMVETDDEPKLGPNPQYKYLQKPQATGEQGVSDAVQNRKETEPQ